MHCIFQIKNYPEFACYRDIVFWWKYLLNPDREAFPNFVDPENPVDVGSVARMSAQLFFDWDQDKSQYKVVAWNLSAPFHCRPDPSKVDPVTGLVIPEEQLPTHRFPSTATPSFYVPLPTIRTEDDVIYRPNLPNFEDSFGQVLNQRDSELLISYLTVPYMRIPLVLTFFSTEDRIPKLQSVELRNILDSVLFEPGKHLSMEMYGVQPLMVPTQYPDLLSSPYGLLLNELCRSPENVLRSVHVLLQGALALDTGCCVDSESDDTFNPSGQIIMYICRLGARVSNFLCFLLEYAKNGNQYMNATLREIYISNEILPILKKGKDELQRVLCEQFRRLFDEYLGQLENETVKNATNEKLINRNSRLACDLHSHKLLLFRNMGRVEGLNMICAKTIAGSFIYLTTRHTWNKATRERGRLLMPETEVYELLCHQRRRLITYIRGMKQGALDELMQTVLFMSSSFTGAFRADSTVLDNSNMWSKIMGERSVGRWGVGSTRTTVSDESTKESIASVALSIDDRNDDVVEIADTGMLPVEIDLQLCQMTLNSKHLQSLASAIANHPDVKNIFGDATMQASLIERAENRQRYRLVGLEHELEYWSDAHTRCPPLGDEWEREYDPAGLAESEKWITSVRNSLLW